MHDVVVVGAGPAGCYAASLLGRKGLKVCVLEEHADIGEPVDCSGVMGAEYFDLLQLPDSLKLGEIRALNFVSPSRLEVHFLPPSPLAYVLDRAALDRAIAEKTLAAGVSFEMGARVTDIVLRDGCVELLYEQSENRAGNDRKTTKAGMVIFAHGPRYRLQRKFGMGVCTWVKRKREFRD